MDSMIDKYWKACKHLLSCYRDLDSIQLIDEQHGANAKQRLVGSSPFWIWKYVGVKGVLSLKYCSIFKNTLTCLYSIWNKAISKSAMHNFLRLQSNHIVRNVFSDESKNTFFAAIESDKFPDGSYRGSMEVIRLDPLDNTLKIIIKRDEELFFQTILFQTIKNSLVLTKISLPLYKKRFITR